MPRHLLSAATPSSRRLASPTRQFAANVLVGVTALLVFAAASRAGAGETPHGPPANAAAASSPIAASGPIWQERESDNFRIRSFGTEPAGPELAEQCEALRRGLYEKWLDCASPQAWRPRCEIVLHDTDESYLRAVGAGASRTVASSLTRHIPGSAIVRRIDIRATRDNWLSSALPHEIMHVLLADQFAGRKLPRWIDEGVALLADPARKQQLHLADAQNALAGHAAFRAVELLMLKDYPAVERWPVFYGQSMSLVRFLVERRTPEDFFTFVQLSLDKGYEPALQEVYQIDDVADLERRWLAEMSRQSTAESPATAAQAVDSPRQSGLRRASVEPRSIEPAGHRQGAIRPPQSNPGSAVPARRG